MSNICLPPALVDSVKQALISGKINPDKLEQMSSEERHNLFKDIVGDGNAKFVNKEFETKMLLKDKQRGYLTWAKNLTGVKEPVKRDLISRIGRMDERILNPVNEKAFLKDLAEAKIGVGVSSDEAKQIANMSSKVQELEDKQRSDGTFPSEADRMAYGRAKVSLGDYLSELKNSANKMSAKDSLLHPVKSSSVVAGTAKSIKAAFDDSALLRQNWKTLLTHPGIWMRNAKKNLADLKNEGIKGQDVIKEVKADVNSRPNAIKGRYQKMGLAIGKVEEEFGNPTLVEKTPVLGRIYKTTEDAFTGLMYRSRADLADHYLKLAEKAKINIDDPEELKSIGSFVNSLTGRANVGRLEGNAAVTLNNIFFSPRFVKSQVDTIGHVLTGAGGSNFVRKEAAKNLMKIVGMSAAIFATADAVKPGSVELDPRSSNFGKIKAGDTTFDLTGGFSPVAVLAARLYTQQYKSSSKGLVMKLGSNPVAPTGDKLVEQFITGKLSPAAQRVWVNLVTKQEYSGAKPTAGSNASNLFMPLPYSTYSDAKHDPHAANALVTEAADAVGISANTNNPAQQVKKLSQADQQLQTKLGNKQFQQYQQQFNDKLQSYVLSDKYKNLPNDQKQTAVTRAEKDIHKNLYKQYNFKAKYTKSNNKTLFNAVDSAVNQ